MLVRLEPGEFPASHPVAIIHEFWLRAAGCGAKPPPWAEFDPADHPKILPWIMLLRRDDGARGLRGPDWRFTVCGSGCTELLGFSCQGKLSVKSFPQRRLNTAAANSIWSVAARALC